MVEILEGDGEGEGSEGNESDVPVEDSDDPGECSELEGDDAVRPSGKGVQKQMVEAAAITVNRP